MDNYTRFIVKETIKAKTALEILSALAIPNIALFIVNDDDKLVGSLSDGDIRRGLLKGLEIEQELSLFINRNSRCFKIGESNFEKYNDYKKLGLRFVPMIDKDRTIIDVVDLQLCKGLLPIDVVLMAGGKGERLRPITDNLPKPLVKVGDKEIIKRNIERLANFGVKNFNIALRHLSDKIIHSIEGEKYHHLLINYVKEEKALGTIGAVRLINSFYNNNIIVMNSDLLTNIDFSELYHTFVQEGADMAVATIPYYVNVPYAIMEIDQNNRIKTLNEKPRYTYYANAGIYLFRKEMQGFIPENQEFDATDFIETLISNGKKVISFPILSYWLDIGRLEEYYKAQEDIKHIQF